MLPQYAEGPLVRVATARHQAEAEMLEGMLLEEGIPSLTRRSGGFDVPDFLASGPRDILVPASGADRAREVLGLRLNVWTSVLLLTGAVIYIAVSARLRPGREELDGEPEPEAEPELAPADDVEHPEPR